jgi:hypothetical protein
MADHESRDTSSPGSGSPPGARPSDPGSAEETHLHVAEMMVGTAMIFVGFLTVLLSISGGFEINVLPVILYFVGLAIWAHARIDHPTVRYVVITLCFAAAAGFFQYGEIHFWHKQAIFWGTVLMAMYFMFTSAKSKRAK